VRRSTPDLTAARPAGEVSFDVENGLRNRLGSMPMEADDIECFVRGIKASGSWVESDWRHKPAVDMQVETFKAMAARCTSTSRSSGSTRPTTTTE
jgi:hypothetical protein